MADSKSIRTLTRLRNAIYEDRYGIRTVVTGPGGQRKSKRFPRGTDLRIIERWRNETKTKLRFIWLHEKAIAAELAKVPSLPGWCYLYVIIGIDCAKIGRSLNPRQRLRELQAGHDTDLELVAAVPCHDSLEAALHERFKHLKRKGEWFALTEELAQFIADLQNGKNPALWIWPAVANRKPCTTEVCTTDGEGRGRKETDEWLESHRGIPPDPPIARCTTTVTSVRRATTSNRSTARREPMDGHVAKTVRNVSVSESDHCVRPHAGDASVAVSRT